MDRKKVAILGSTGSIGRQTLEVIRENGDKFQVAVLVANNNIDILIEQAREFIPNTVVIVNETHYSKLKKALKDTDIKVLAGKKAALEAVSFSFIAIYVCAIVGFAGLATTLEAAKSGKRIALANKESLVVAGELLQQRCQQYGTELIPVDSEHSAIFQCLVGERRQAVKKILLTASGGALRNHSLEELENVTVKEALKHPTWTMGQKITIDTATLANKGLEVIEAHWLFELPAERIEVIVHPESIIHSMVQFCDNSIKAQMGKPTMKHPIAYAMNYPNRLPVESKDMDFTALGNLSFSAPDHERFPVLQLAYEALHMGGNMPCIFNAANEAVVELFLRGKVAFLSISQRIEQTMRKFQTSKVASSYSEYQYYHHEAKQYTSLEGK